MVFSGSLFQLHKGGRAALPSRVFSCEKTEHHKSLKISGLGLTWTKINKEVRGQPQLFPSAFSPISWANLISLGDRIHTTFPIHSIFIKGRESFLSLPFVLLHHSSILSTLALLKPFILPHCSDHFTGSLRNDLGCGSLVQKALLKQWTSGFHCAAAEAGWPMPTYPLNQCVLNQPKVGQCPSLQAHLRQGQVLC